MSQSQTTIDPNLAVKTFMSYGYYLRRDAASRISDLLAQKNFLSRDLALSYLNTVTSSVQKLILSKNDSCGSFIELGL
jgi:hypothetical protein